MADPSYAECWTAIKTAIWIIHQDYLELATNSEKYIDHEDDLKVALQKFDAPYLSASVDALTAYRASRVSTLVSARSIIDPLLVQMARVILSPEASPLAILVDLYAYMIAQAPDDTVLSSSSTFGTPSAITGTGDPSIQRLSVDQYGYDLEGGAFGETRTYEVRVDQALGADAGSEEWYYSGPGTGPDLIEEDGSGIRGFIGTDSANSSSSLLQNSSFGDLDGTADSAAGLTSIPGWTVDSAIANFQIDTALTFRQSDEETTAYSLQFDATDGISQALSVNGIQVDDPEETPWIFSFRWNKNGATGSLSYGQGSQSGTTAVTTQSGWNFQSLTVDKELYYNNWKIDEPTVFIRWVGEAGFTIDECYFGPMRRIGPDGAHTWKNIFAGATDLLFGDLFTEIDADAKTGIIQRWLKALYGFTLPHSGSPTIAEPT